MAVAGMGHLRGLFYVPVEGSSMNRRWLAPGQQKRAGKSQELLDAGMSNLGTSGLTSSLLFHTSPHLDHIIPILVYWPIPVLSWPILEAELSSTTPYPPYQRFVLILAHTSLSWHTTALS